MPLAAHRDLSDTQTRLTTWLTERIAAEQPAATHVRAGEVSSPTAAGFANETLLFDLSYDLDGRERTEPLIARVKADHPIFPEYDFAIQFETLRAVGAGGVPVPNTRWVEPDDSVLGAAFLVADRVPGEVPNDAPTYHAEGWVADLAHYDRAAIWWGGIESMAAIHRLDWKTAFGFLERPGTGTHQSRELGYWRRYLEWAREGRDYAPQQHALDWLEANEPPEGKVSLCWGDARIGNIIYQGTDVAAILDWEMATIGAPEMDLAWTLFLDWHHSDGYSIPRLEGLPERAETIARYEALTGTDVTHIDYWEAFAAARFAMIYVRIDKVAKRLRLVDADAPDLGLDNPCVTWLEAHV